MIFLRDYGLKFILYHIKPCFTFFLNAFRQNSGNLWKYEGFFVILESLELFKIYYTRSDCKQGFYLFTLNDIFFLESLYFGTCSSSIQAMFI